MNVVGLFSNLVHLGATWVLWLLVGLSVLALGIIVERAIFLLKSAGQSERLAEVLERALAGSERADWEGLATELLSGESAEERVVAETLKARYASEAEELLLAACGQERLRAERYLSFLGTLGNNAPFVGLLGTVVGIIGAFNQLDASGGQLTTGLMAEIGEALVATAVGLLVALPAVAAYNAFQRVIHTRVQQGEFLARKVVARLHALSEETV